MTLEECYGQIGGNYENVLARLGKEEKVLKYLRLFLGEECFSEIGKALDEKEYKKAFEHAHNLKGAALNLSLDELYKEAAVLCDALRGEEPVGDVDAMYEAVARECEKIRTAAGEFMD